MALSASEKTSFAKQMMLSLARGVGKGAFYKNDRPFYVEGIVEMTERLVDALDEMEDKFLDEEDEKDADHAEAVEESIKNQREMVAAQDPEPKKPGSYSPTHRGDCSCDKCL